MLFTGCLQVIGQTPKIDSKPRPPQHAEATHGQLPKGRFLRFRAALHQRREARGFREDLWFLVCSIPNTPWNWHRLEGQSQVVCTLKRSGSRERWEGGVHDIFYWTRPVSDRFIPKNALRVGSSAWGDAWNGCQMLSGVPLFL